MRIDDKLPTETKRDRSTLEILRSAVRSDPRSRDRLVALGTALLRGGPLEECLAVWRQAVLAAPSDVRTHVGLAQALVLAERLADAEEAALRALELQPEHPEALFALGSAFQYGGRAEQALGLLHRALAGKPDSPAIATNLGLAYLALGRYAEGWPYYEMRFAVRGKKIAKGMEYAQPRWQGGDPQGRTILLHAEQGLGDTFQFVRFVPRLAERGGRVLLRVDRKLCPLLRYSLTGVRPIPHDEPPPAFDAWLPLASLARWLGVTLESLPGRMPYLRADPRRRAGWRKRLGPRVGTLRIGLVWAGNPGYAFDRKRSLPLEALAHLASVPNSEFYSLQFGAPAAETEHCRTFDVHSLGDTIEPFEELAALMCELDLVVSVDTGAAHLAGGLNVPCWVLLGAHPDWRWLQGRIDSPWYPSVRLFRQRTPGDWSDPILEATDSLRQAVRTGQVGP